jgi:hypothetical protein
VIAEREFKDDDGCLWRVVVYWHPGTGAAAEGKPLPKSYRVLLFQQVSPPRDGVRYADYRDDWDAVSDERLREILAKEARQASEWA